MEICKRIKKVILIIILLLFSQFALADSIFESLQKSKKTSYLDFVLLKLESKLIQRHGLLGTQPLALRVQYQSVGSQVDFSKKESMYFESLPVKNISWGFSCSIIFFIEKNVIKFERKYSHRSNFIYRRN